MKISEKGLELIKDFESFRSKSYLDSNQTATIGYGTTIYPNGVKVTMWDNPIDEKSAVEYLKYHLEKEVYPYLNKLELECLIKTQNEFDALCSFCYNLGVKRLKSSTLLQMIEEGKTEKIKESFQMWCMAGGKRLEGLFKRRTKEAELFLTT